LVVTQIPPLALYENSPAGVPDFTAKTGARYHGRTKVLRYELRYHGRTEVLRYDDCATQGRIEVLRYDDCATKVLRYDDYPRQD
jgi:hypothetical protein